MTRSQTTTEAIALHFYRQWHPLVVGFFSAHRDFTMPESVANGKHSEKAVATKKGGLKLSTVVGMKTKAKRSRSRKRVPRTRSRRGQGDDAAETKTKARASPARPSPRARAPSRQPTIRQRAVR